MSNSFNEEYRFGSAGWASGYELAAAGLFKTAGPQIGYWENKPLYLDGDAPLITIGGAGSGKLRDLLSYVVCNTPGQRMLILDPRGELGAISIHAHAPNNEYAYFWNPMGLLGLPQHGCNPLDILQADSPNFHADCKFTAESMIPLSGASNGQYFELRGRGFLENLMKSLVETNGKTSLPDLYRLINTIETDPQKWADRLEAMLKSEFEGVRRTAGEMLAKQQDSPKEFGSIMGEIYAHMNYLDDPVLLASLEATDFSLEELCDPCRSTKIFLNIPAEYLSIWSPLVRLFFSVSMLYKSRFPDRPRVMLLVDEAGQLGRFEGLLRAFTYGRGAGLRAWAIFQDAGQIIKNFSAPALQGFIGSAQMRQFFGVRDYETAQLVSNMLGSETLQYDDTLRQDAARQQKMNAIRSVFEGKDPLAAAYDIAHHDRGSAHRTKQVRKLMTPDEILAMPEDRQVLFVSGKNLPPIFAHKYPYFLRPEMAGLYMPNPYHPPTDKVQVATRFGTKWAEIITEPVPNKYSTYPQYQNGYRSYVKGHKPD